MKDGKKVIRETPKVIRNKGSQEGRRKGRV
jgi:hypothetical protein